ncbi:MAG: putative zinc-binding protein [Lentisphaerota bacterium]
MSDQKNCACSAAPKLIFPCSGAADVGAIADQAARQLTREGIGRMFCLAGIGGRVSGIIKTTESAEKILAIDGCPLNCAKNCLEQAGFTKFEHMNLADLGLVKGQSAVSEDNIHKVVDSGKAKLSCI